MATEQSTVETPTPLPISMGDKTILESLGILGSISSTDRLWIEHRDTESEGEWITSNEGTEFKKGMDIRIMRDPSAITRPLSRYWWGQSREVATKAVDYLATTAIERLNELSKLKTCSLAEAHLKARLRDEMKSACTGLQHLINHYESLGDSTGLTAKVRFERSKDALTLCVTIYDGNQHGLVPYDDAEDVVEDDGGYPPLRH